MNSDPPAPSTAYKDSSAGLMVFGILTILGGCLCGLFVVLALLAPHLAPATQTPSPRALQLFVPFIYGSVAVVEIWLGIGSILARRWARALLLIYSWSWLIFGSVGVIGAAFLLPRIWDQIAASQTASKPGAVPNAQIVGLIAAATMGVFFVLIPAIWGWFYGRRNVKLTCETRDPQPCWTDRCPLPVLAICLWLVVGALAMLVTPFVFHGVFPFFGVMLSGPAGFAVFALVAAIYFYCARSLYRLEAAGWWVLVTLLCLSALSRILTWSRYSLLDYYRAIGYSEADITRLANFPFMQGHTLIWTSFVSTLPFLGYLLFVRRYLRDSA